MEKPMVETHGNPIFEGKKDGLLRIFSLNPSIDMLVSVDIPTINPSEIGVINQLSERTGAPPCSNPDFIRHFRHLWTSTIRGAPSTAPSGMVKTTSRGIPGRQASCHSSNWWKNGGLLWFVYIRFNILIYIYIWFTIV